MGNDVIPIQTSELLPALLPQAEEEEVAVAEEEEVEEVVVVDEETEEEVAGEVEEEEPGNFVRFILFSFYSVSLIYQHQVF